MTRPFFAVRMKKRVAGGLVGFMAGDALSYYSYQISPMVQW
jgi:hypothetical protein